MLYSVASTEVPVPRLPGATVPRTAAAEALLPITVLETKLPSVGSVAEPMFSVALLKPGLMVEPLPPVNVDRLE